MGIYKDLFVPRASYDFLSFLTNSHEGASRQADFVDIEYSKSNGLFAIRKDRSCAAFKALKLMSKENVVLENIVNAAKVLLNEAGLDYTPDECWIEYNHYKNGNNMPYTIHDNDYQLGYAPLNTVIFYINKTVKGGDLAIYSDDEQRIIDTIKIAPTKENIHVVVLDGTVKHDTMPITTDGSHECILVHLSSNKRRKVPTHYLLACEYCGNQKVLHCLQEACRKHNTA